VLTQRMEAVLRASVQSADAKTAYDTRQVYLLLQRQHRVSRGKVGWMQLEVRRDKAKLAQGMQRLAKAKAK